MCLRSVVMTTDAYVTHDDQDHAAQECGQAQYLVIID